MTADRISRSEARVLAEEEFTRFADLVASLRRCGVQRHRYGGPSVSR
jgi:hypothetical protein